MENWTAPSESEKRQRKVILITFPLGATLLLLYFFKSYKQSGISFCLGGVYLWHGVVDLVCSCLVATFPPFAGRVDLLLFFCIIYSMPDLVKY